LFSCTSHKPNITSAEYVAAYSTSIE
jgi:hypothetical protein